MVLPSRRFYLCAACLRCESPFARPGARFRRLPLPRARRRLLHERHKALTRRPTIRGLRAMLPAVDDEHPAGGETAAARMATRSFTSSGSADAATLKRSSTAVATLLTFWPPGPDARTKRSSISLSFSASNGVIAITV